QSSTPNVVDGLAAAVPMQQYAFTIAKVQIRAAAFLFARDRAIRFGPIAHDLGSYITGLFQVVGNVSLDIDLGFLARGQAHTVGPAFAVFGDRFDAPGAVGLRFRLSVALLAYLAGISRVLSSRRLPAFFCCGASPRQLLVCPKKHLTGLCGKTDACGGCGGSVLTPQ